MNESIPAKLGIIAGKGHYPLLLAESARQQGVREIFALAFHGETERRIQKLADRVVWVRLGQLSAAYAALQASGVPHFVMAGQITPTSLFNMRMDRELLALLGRLRERNAHSIFGALTAELSQRGIEMLPASRFMEAHMPDPGILTTRAPTPEQQADIELGQKVAKTTSGLEIGQTVAIKNGTILAVEAFEGTDETIQRAGKLGGPGAVVVKVSKRGHDVRFDLPVVGERTLKSLRKAGVAVLAVEARRTILLDRPAIIAQAERQGLCLVAIETTEN
ncbi:MAG: LpxI family protein [Verrucomicrobia bacterium]|nr:MAG: LpxI family protein [Verrucomicrobiota bacterium]